MSTIKDLRIGSIFIGGGTPSIFVDEYERLFELLEGYIDGDIEITLEANPNDLTTSRLSGWRELGFNRISLGVQTFDKQGLLALTREHSRKEAIDSIDLAKGHFKNINVDLIYGWHEQSVDQWREDLRVIGDLSPNHLSLYLLDYSGKTPFSRLQRSGQIGQESSEYLEKLYLEACKALREEGFDHEEVSNWSKPGFSCHHNWIYWQMKPYLAVGAGSHGYLDNCSIGTRYSYPSSLLGFVQSPRIDLDFRTLDHWLMEYTTTSLRTKKGVLLDKIFDKTGCSFAPSSVVTTAIDRGLIKVDGNQLTLVEAEWFRENAWSFEVYRCFNQVHSESIACCRPQ